MPGRVVEAMWSVHFYDKNNPAVSRNIDGEEEKKEKENNHLPACKDWQVVSKLLSSAFSSSFNLAGGTQCVSHFSANGSNITVADYLNFA